MNKTEQNKAILHHIIGVKCDNPKCGWRDEQVEFIPEKLLNTPCPDCGSNLFTQEAWDQMKLLQAFIDSLNNFVGEVPKSEPRVLMELLHDENGMINGARIKGKETNDK
jgi:hypothetical protein